MRHSASLLLPASALFIISSFSACLLPYTVTSPLVPESRQKENYHYMPAVQNAPLLTEKNDLSASFQLSNGDNYAGIALQAAYLPLKHAGLAISYSSLNHSADETTNRHFEMGAGYTTALNKLWHFETYAGYGTGKLENKYSTGRSTIRNNGFFIQPAIVFLNRKKNVQLGFVTKLTGNHFNITDSSFAHDLEPYTTSQLQLVANTPFQLFWEPGFVCRFGWKNFLFHTSFSYLSNLTTSDLHFIKENFTIGVCVKLNTGKQASN